MEDLLYLSNSELLSKPRVLLMFARMNQNIVSHPCPSFKEDILQEAMLIFLKSPNVRKSFNPTKGKFRAFLNGCFYRNVMKALGRRSRKRNEVLNKAMSYGEQGGHYPDNQSTRTSVTFDDVFELSLELGGEPRLHAMLMCLWRLEKFPSVCEKLGIGTRTGYRDVEKLKSHAKQAGLYGLQKPPQRVAVLPPKRLEET